MPFHYFLQEVNQSHCIDLLSFLINTLIAANGAGDSFRSVIPPYLALGGIAFSVLVGVLAGLYPSQRAMRLSALAAIRNE